MIAQANEQRDQGEHCPVCRVWSLKVNNHFGIRCCGACQTFCHNVRNGKTKIPSKCQNGDGLCWEKLEDVCKRPPNKSQCNMCRLWAFKTLGSKLVAKFIKDESIADPKKKKDLCRLAESQSASCHKRRRPEYTPALVNKDAVIGSISSSSSAAGSDTIGWKLSQDDLRVLLIRMSGSGLQLLSAADAVHIQIDDVTMRFYTLNSLEWIHEAGKRMLCEDIVSVIENGNNNRNSLERAINATDIHFVEAFAYERNCTCGKSSPNDVYHNIHDWLIRIGDVDPEKRACNANLTFCEHGRVLDAYTFTICLLDSFKLNPFGVQLGRLREIFRRPELDPSNCAHCGQYLERNSTHLVSNLLCELGLATDAELRQYSSRNCTFNIRDESKAQKGVPIRARDVLDYLVFSGRFFVFGPLGKNLPPNNWSHSKSDVVCCEWEEVANRQQILDNRTFVDEQQLCFAFCRRRNENKLTEGNRMLSG